MRYTTKTEYGLICLTYLANNPNKKVVNLSEIIQNEHFSHTYIEKIMQNLRASNIVKSHQGKQGGYSLIKKPSQITLKEIIEALEGTTFDIFCDPSNRDGIVCTHFYSCGVRPIWKKTKELLDNFFRTTTLEMIAQEELHETLVPTQALSTIEAPTKQTNASEKNIEKT